MHKIDECKKEFTVAMDDDFNTANGIAAIFELVRLANVYLLEKNTESSVLTYIYRRHLRR